MTSWGTVYRDNAAAILQLAPTLSADQLDAYVPATPGWTTRDVIAHLAGGPADALTGRMDGAPSAAWTARHVAERADRSLQEVLDEFAANIEPAAAAFGDSPRPALVWDLAVHHADLHEALGLGRPPDQLWLPVAEAIVATFGDRATALSAVDRYELFRAAFSRRSQAQMQAWGTALDPEALDGLCIFGPRTDDQPIPNQRADQ